jgi:hypothetical protein
VKRLQIIPRKNSSQANFGGRMGLGDQPGQVRDRDAACFLKNG